MVWQGSQTDKNICWMCKPLALSGLISELDDCRSLSFTISPFSILPSLIHFMFCCLFHYLNPLSSSQFPVQKFFFQKIIKIENLVSKLGCIHYTMEYYEVSFIKDKVDFYIAT